MKEPLQATGFSVFHINYQKKSVCLSLGVTASPPGSQRVRAALLEMITHDKFVSRMVLPV
jgi:hypothetical protein